jgi:hypothetical protein
LQQAEDSFSSRDFSCMIIFSVITCWVGGRRALESVAWRE